MRFTAYLYRYRLYALLTCLLTGITICNAQESKVLLPERKADLSDTTQIKHLIRRADSTANFNTAESFALYNEALKSSRAFNFNKGTFHALYGIATSYYINENYPKSIIYLEQSKRYLSYPENTRYTGTVYNSIAICESLLGNYNAALTYYHKALNALSHNNKNMGIDSASVYLGIANTWRALNEYEYAIESYNSAGRVLEKRTDTVRLAHVQTGMAGLYLLQHDYHNAEDLYRKALTVIDADNDLETYLSILLNMALLKQEKGDYNTALDFLEQADIASENNSFLSPTVLKTGAVKGAIYLDMGAYEKAYNLLHDSYNKASRNNNASLIEYIEPELSEAAAKTGRYHEAYNYLLHNYNTKDTLFKKEKKKSLETMLEIRMAEKDKAMLNKELFIARQKTELREKNLWIGGIIAGACMLLAISFGLIKGYRHRQHVHESMILQLQQQQEINQLKAQVRGEEQERQRIARELHNNIASQLWAIKLNVENIRLTSTENNGQDKRLDSIFQQLSEATHDLRKTAHNLMPDLLIEDGLTTAIAATCERLNTHTNMQVDFQEYGVLPDIDPELELSIYRMVQELIQNAMKHALEATHILIQVSCAGTLLNITVEDNGKFFDDANPGIGLQEILKKTEAMKGHFDIQHAKGKGTTAYMEFDVNHLL